MSLNFLVYNERQAHGSDIFSLAVSGNCIYSTSSDGHIKAWNLTTNDLTDTFESVFSDGGRSIDSAENTLIGLSFTGDLKVVDTTEKRISAPFSNPETQEASGETGVEIDWCTAISPDATTIATTTSRGTLKVYDLESKSLVASIPTRHAKYGMCIDYAPNNRAIATGHQGGGLFLFDTVSGKLKHSLSHLETIRSVKFSPSSDLLAVVGDTKAVTLYDTKSGEQVASIQGHANIITCVDWNQTGELLVTVSLDGRIKVWNVPRRECVGTFTENIGHKLWCVRWCKMGNSKMEGFVVGGSERVLRFYLPTTT